MFILIVIFLSIQNTYCLTCNDVLDMPKNSKIKLNELKTLSPKDVVDCLCHLEKVKQSFPEAEFIWDSIINYYNEMYLIPEEILSSLNWITVAIQPDDYQNLTLSSIEVITNFGRDYDLSYNQLLAIAERVREDFGDKQPEDYTVYDLTALRQILCAFEESEIKRIKPKAYKEAAPVIGKIKNCIYEVMRGFASLATDKDAFGPPENWEKETICSIGNVTKYLSDDVLSILKEKLGDDFVENIDKTCEEEHG